MANLWRIFGKMNETAIINTIATAIGNMDQARIIYNDITKQLEKESYLQTITKSKYASTITAKDQIALDNQRLDRYQTIKKQSKLEKQITLHYYEIKRLKDNNISWRNIARYLKDNYKIKISHAQVRNLYQKIKSILEVKNAN